MFDKNDWSIKYIIGSYIDNDKYPEISDIVYVLKNWYYNENGYKLVNKKLEYNEINHEIVFTNSILENCLNLNKEKINQIIKNLLDKKIIKIIKTSKVNSYYKLI